MTKEWAAWWERVATQVVAYVGDDEDRRKAVTRSLRSLVTKLDRKKPRATFQPPAVEDVAAYCAERDNGIDAHEFCDHYEAKGWVVGKAKMVDWRAAVRTWERFGMRRNGKPRSTKAIDELLG